MPNLTKMNERPKEGLSVNPGGGLIQNTGCGDREGEVIRASVILTNSEVNSSVFNIKSVSQIGALISFTKGSLTNVILTPYFSDDAQGTWYKLIGGALSAGVITVSPLTFLIAASLNCIIPIQNPGATRMKISAKGTGTVTSSLLVMSILRGWGSSRIIV